MAFLDELFGGGQQAGFEDIERGAGQSQDLIRQFLQQGLGFLDPFQKAGVGALGQFQQELGARQDPTAFLNRIMGQFQESPGAKFQQQQGLEAAKSAAQAAGTLGSGAQQRALTQFGQGVSSQDMQQYLQNVLGIGQQRMGGLQSLIGGGQQAAGQEAGLTEQAGSQLAQLQQLMSMAQAGESEAGAGGLARLLGFGGRGLLGRELGGAGKFGKGIGTGIGTLLGLFG
jgi:hypothetical protein